MSGFGAKIFEALMWPLQRLPLGFHYFWGDFFAWLARDVLKYRRDIVITNLSRSFPEKKYKEITKLADGFYDHLGEIFAETIWFGGCRNNPERLHKRKLCVIEDVNPLLKSYAERPGVMILSSHFGNWELTGGMYQYVYQEPEENEHIPLDKTCVVYKRIQSDLWDHFFKENRCAVNEGYNGYVESSRVLYFAIDHLHDKMLYIFPTDQHPYKKASFCVIPEFMHQETKAMIGGATLASRFGFAVYNMAFDRKERGRYSVRLECICEDASKMKPAEIMTEYYRILEEDIKRNPVNYLWSHKRWK